MSSEKIKQNAAQQKRTKEKSWKKIKKTLFVSAILAVLVSGSIFYLLDKFNILRYDEITSALRLSDGRILKNSPEKNKLYVHFIDVGQGDAALIQYNGASVLIDSGEEEYAPKIIRYLKQNDVDKLEMVIATHPHSDHIGAMPQIIHEIKTDSVLMPDIPTEIIGDNPEYINLMNTLEELELTPNYPEFSDTFDFGENIKFKVVSSVVANEDNLNNYSIVIKLTYKNTSFLFTGDAEKEAEYNIIRKRADLSADVLKVGHHGSDTSTTERFLKYVKPEFCVISCGLGNQFNHPQSKIIERLKKYTENIYRTDLDGTIICITDGETYEFVSER